MGLNYWYVAYKHLGSQLVVVLRSRKRSLSPICVCGEIIWENSSAPSNEIDVQCREMIATITFVQGKQSIRGQPCARESIKFKATCRKSKFYKLLFFVVGCEIDHLRDTPSCLDILFFYSDNVNNEDLPTNCQIDPSMDQESRTKLFLVLGLSTLSKCYFLQQRFVVHHK